MTDVIWGTVTNILDANTFEINVTHREQGNKEQYQGIQKIIITEIEVPEVPNSSSSRSKEILERNLKEKFVRCDIEERSNGAYRAKVSLSGIGGY